MRVFMFCNLKKCFDYAIQDVYGRMNLDEKPNRMSSHD